MAPTKHQQIPEGDAFVEPRNVETVRGLLKAAEALGVDPATVRTQSGGYLAPTAVVEHFLEGSFDEAAEAGVIVSTAEKSADLSEVEVNEFGFVVNGESAEGETGEQVEGTETGESTDGAETGEDVGESTETEEVEVVYPAKSAAKPEWVAFAVAQSAKTDEPLTEEQATALTTAQLIERFGASE